MERATETGWVELTPEEEEAHHLYLRAFEVNKSVVLKARAELQAAAPEVWKAYTDLPHCGSETERGSRLNNGRRILTPAVCGWTQDRMPAMVGCRWGRSGSITGRRKRRLRGLPQKSIWVDGIKKMNALGAKASNITESEETA